MLVKAEICLSHQNSWIAIVRKGIHNLNAVKFFLFFVIGQGGVGASLKHSFSKDWIDLLKQ